MPQNPRKILAVVDDLFFVVKINDAARRAGMVAEFLKSEDAVVEKAMAERPSMVIIDLNCGSVAPVPLIEDAAIEAGAEERQHRRFRLAHPGRTQNAGPERRRGYGARSLRLLTQPVANPAAPRGVAAGSLQPLSPRNDILS